MSTLRQTSFTEGTLSETVEELKIGAEISEGEGSRIRIKLNNIRAVFHRPHPKKETDKGAVASMKRFLENAGIKP